MLACAPMEWVELDSRLCHESKILAAQPQPVENAPGVSRRFYRSFYLHFVPRTARCRRAGTDPGHDAFQLAGGVIRHLNRRGDVHRPDGRRRAGGPLRA